MKCPKKACEYECESLRSLSQHWRMSHTRNLKESHPELYGLTVECNIEGCEKVFESEYARDYHISDFHKSSEHKCQECGDEFHRPPSNLSGEFLFCSMKCRNQNDQWKDSIRDTVNKLWESEEHREKVIESSKGQKPSHANKRYIEELGHYVDSTWEEIVGLALKNEGIGYENEPEFKRPSGHSYYPDFVIGKTVIEVKGYADDKSIQKADEFLDNYPEYRYIVFGDELPSDTHISVKGSSQKSVFNKIPELLEEL